MPNIKGSEQISGNGFSTTFTYDGQDVLLDQNSNGTSVKYFNGLRIDNELRSTPGLITRNFFRDQLNMAKDAP